MLHASPSANLGPQRIIPMQDQIRTASSKAKIVKFGSTSLAGLLRSVEGQACYEEPLSRLESEVTIRELKNVV